MGKVRECVSRGGGGGKVGFSSVVDGWVGGFRPIHTHTAFQPHKQGGKARPMAAHARTFMSEPTKNHMLLCSRLSPTTSHLLSPSMARFRMVFFAMRT